MKHVDGGSYANTTFGVDIPSVFFFRPNNSYVEAGLDELKFFRTGSSAQSAGTWVETAISPFGEYGILTGTGESAWRFKAGARATLGNFLGSYQPNESSGFFSDQSNSTAILAVAPGFLYAFSERLFLDGAISMDLFTFGRYSSRVDNPAIPIRQQKTSEWRHDFVPGVYNFKIGVVFKLSNSG